MILWIYDITLNEYSYLGRALMKFSTALRNIDILLNGVSKPNLIITLIKAFGDLLALMIRKRAIDPLDNVATSLVVAKRAVVVNKVTRSTNHVEDPVPDVSFEGFEVATCGFGRAVIHVEQVERINHHLSQQIALTLSPMSYGRLTKISKSPSK